MRKLNGIIEFVEKYIFANIAVVLFMLAVFWMVFEALSRFFLSNSYNASEEVITFSVFWAMMLSMAEAGKKGYHIRIDLLLALLPKRAVALLDTINMLLGILFAGILMYSCYLYIPHLYNMGLTSASTMRLPLWGVYMVVPLSAILLFIYYFRGLIANIKAFFKGEEVEQPKSEVEVILEKGL